MAGVAEVYLPAFGLALGMSPVLAGLLTSVPLLAGGVLQLVAPRVIQRVSSLRGWVVVCMAVQALAFVPLLIVALRGSGGGRGATGVVFGAASVYWAAGMAASAGWTPWTARVIPARIRNRFFGRRQGLMQVAMLAGLIGSGAALRAATGTSHVLAVYAGDTLAALNQLAANDDVQNGVVRTSTVTLLVKKGQNVINVAIEHKDKPHDNLAKAKEVAALILKKL